MLGSSQIMIVVTGTQRSGTSLWMQILAAGGFPVIGERFPPTFEGPLRAANPRGFFESQLIHGIYYRTNPSPETGAFLFPEDTRAHAVKVFATGLVRSDIAYLDRVIATVRPWREYTRSLERLRALSAPPHEPSNPPSLSPALQWWSENYALVRDAAIRQYPIHVLSYASLLDDPQTTIAEVFEWLGRGDVAAAIDMVDPELQTQRGSDDLAEPPAIAPEHIATFDLLYETIHRQRDLDAVLVERLNDTQRALAPALADFEAQATRAALHRVSTPGDPA